jgi:hypothetical protein
MTLPSDISAEAQAYLRNAVAPEPRALTLDAIAERRACREASRRLRRAQDA